MSHADGVNAKLVDTTEKYLRESYKPDLSRLCQCFYSIPHGDTRANSLSESNNALLVTKAKVNANNQLHTAARKINLASQKRYEDLRADALVALRRTVVSRNKESAIGTPESDVARNIVSAMVAKATFQSQLAEGLDCCVSAKDGDISATFLLRERPRNIPSDQVLPFYHQTHTVTCTKQTASDGVEYWCFTCRCSEVSQC